MRTLIFGIWKNSREASPRRRHSAKQCLAGIVALATPFALLVPFMAGRAEDNGQDKNKKIEITYSLSGPQMFQTFCAPCHGQDGKGNGPAASALKKAPADLTVLSKKNGGHFPAERVRNFIEGKNPKTVDAHGSREMPIWGDVFRSIADDDGAVRYRIFTLSSYLETLQVK